MKSCVHKFTSSDKPKSKSARVLREHLASVRSDCVHQELLLRLSCVVAVDVGVSPDACHASAGRRRISGTHFSSLRV